MIFDYPAPREHRRHEPRGYLNYGSYRPWLRDEFIFRCVYCLKREQWGTATGEFDIDHFQPQVLAQERAVDYFNLLYACRRCNEVKSDQAVDDPFDVLTNRSIRITITGAVESIDQHSHRLILQLDSPRLMEWRLLWMRIVALASDKDRELLRQLVGYPKDLPDLRPLRPPGGNGLSAGLAESSLVLREQGLLSDSY